MWKIAPVIPASFKALCAAFLAASSADFLADSLVSATYALIPSTVVALSIALWKIAPVIPASFKALCAAFLAAASAAFLASSANWF